MGNLRNRIAAIVHTQWAHWMLRQIDRGQWENGELVLNCDDMERWMRLARLHYSELSESEQESDLQWADKYLEVMEEWKGESSIEKVPTWQIFTSSDDLVYTIEADFYRVEEDGSLAFYKKDGMGYPVGVVASYSWVIARGS